MTEDQLDWVFKALAHPERRRILTSLHKRPNQSLFELCVASLSDNGQPLARQTISQHLELLEKAELLEIAWQGRTKVHAFNPAPLKSAIAKSIAKLL
jgi:DNA-binding transcriptional ArsR family regulator